MMEGVLFQILQLGKASLIRQYFIKYSDETCHVFREIIVLAKGTSSFQK